MPEISVLIPLYNRKKYAAACIESVLNQTFQDFEIIIRDDCPTDGVFDFIQNHFSNQISAGKIKLFQNTHNLGEARTCNKLFKDATTGKYFTILHNDDFYLPHALKPLYQTSKTFSAKVVHASYCFSLPVNQSTIENCIPVCNDNNAFENIILMPDDLNSRFLKWINQNTFHDTQHNLYNRNFILQNDFLTNLKTNRRFLCYNGATEKTFVKTPVIFIKHNSDSQTCRNFCQKF